jgi:hypothetical protein
LSFVPKPRPRHAPPTLPAPRLPDTSGPEITLQPAALGRETLVAIAESEAEEARAILDRRRRPAVTATRLPIQKDPPQVSIVVQRPATGRAGDEDDSPARGTLDTVSFSDRPATERPPRRGSEPEISTQFVPVGRATMAAISNEMAEEFLRTLTRQEGDAWHRQIAGAEIQEPHRFRVRGAPMLARATEAQRIEFVESRLLHYLPVRTTSDVMSVRVVETSKDGTLTLEVWINLRP